MKKYFITGLIILLPLALTIIMVTFVFNFLTTPFLGIVKMIFDYYGLFEGGFLFLSASQLQTILAKLLILFCLFVVTVTLGLITRWFFFHTIIKCAEYIVKRIPLVRVIYKTSKDVIKTLFSTQSNAFKQVVLVRFPSPQTYSIGFITKDNISSLQESFYHDVVAVFVPTTPNPTSGFLMMYKKEDLIYLDMKVDEAMKFVMSCGVVLSDFSILSPQQGATKIYEPSIS